MVVLDTSVIIDHLRLQKAQAESRLMRFVRERPKESLALSMSSIQELYEGQSTRDAVKEQFLLATIAPLKILPYTYEAAKLAGEIARDLPRPIELADAAIAAIAVVNGYALYTLNKKDFMGIDGLALVD